MGNFGVTFPGLFVGWFVGSLWGFSGLFVGGLCGNFVDGVSWRVDII